MSASRFLRPYYTREKMLQSLKIKRIKDEMSFAAKKGNCYHLWWHPHNFGDNVDANLAALIELLEHYQRLNKKYYFQSYNMNELAVLLNS